MEELVKKDLTVERSLVDGAPSLPAKSPFMPPMASSVVRRTSASTPGGFARYNTGSPEPRIETAA